MKANRIFKSALVAVMAMAHSVGAFFNAPSRPLGGTGRVSNGRAAFYGVSAPKCHTQRKRWF